MVILVSNRHTPVRCVAWLCWLQLWTCNHLQYYMFAITHLLFSGLTINHFQIMITLVPTVSFSGLCHFVRFVITFKNCNSLMPCWIDRYVVGPQWCEFAEQLLAKQSKYLKTSVITKSWYGRQHASPTKAPYLNKPFFKKFNSAVFYLFFLSSFFRPACSSLAIFCKHPTPPKKTNKQTKTKQTHTHTHTHTINGLPVDLQCSTEEKNIVGSSTSDSGLQDPSSVGWGSQLHQIED